MTRKGGDNCPLDRVVASEIDCQQAASELGYTYEAIQDGSRYPAGCYLYLNYGRVYFNSITDPSMTSGLYGSYGAICKAGT